MDGTAQAWQNAGHWGLNNYLYNSPQGVKRFLWAHTYIRFVITNNSENCRLRFYLVSNRRPDPHTANNYPDFYTDVDTPQIQQRYRVHYIRTLTFDTPKESGVSYNQKIELNYYFPWNRVQETYNTLNAGVNDQTAWNGYTRHTDYPAFIITSDDGTAVDNEFVNIDMYLEHKFYLN